MLNQKNLTEFNLGESANLFLLLTKVEKKSARTGREYLDLDLRDKSTSIAAKMWDGFELFYNQAEEGNIVKVACQFDEFNGMPQLRITNIRLAKESDNVTHSDFLPVSLRDLDEMKTEFNEAVSSISNTHLKSLIEKIFDNETKEKYFDVPAGKAWHHAYIHGLLEHTLEIIRICDLACDIHPELNRDLLIAAVILHDFGKVEELTYKTSFDYTDKGRLIGHIVIAASRIEETAKQISDFPEVLKNQLIHLVLSHQGKLEHASPVLPKMAEAVVLYHADELSAKSNAFLNAIKNEKQDKSNWTNFIRLAETPLYVPPKSEDENVNDSLFDF
ncbi:3'-_5' exoribonuclease Bsu YhaM [hydrothermal vent metagenome]|uniref:3'->5' exoribonuclease Bsu YhaM n=1 Tax=hydrothermal vent metagenome TaxID=652676 RepID=A0A3B1BVN8_9ZZZZ